MFVEPDGGETVIKTIANVSVIRSMGVVQLSIPLCVSTCVCLCAYAYTSICLTILPFQTVQSHAKMQPPAHTSTSFVSYSSDTHLFLSSHSNLLTLFNFSDVIHHQPIRSSL